MAIETVIEGATICPQINQVTSFQFQSGLESKRRRRESSTSECHSHPESVETKVDDESAVSSTIFVSRKWEMVDPINRSCEHAGWNVHSFSNIQLLDFKTDQLFIGIILWNF